jgi:hypothetical protein
MRFVPMLIRLGVDQKVDHIAVFDFVSLAL